MNRVFFERCPRQVAADLIGCRLIHEVTPGVRLEGTLVEVEAYLGDGSDPGSHAHNGPTGRNAAMFGPAGRFYVYRSMGIHLCVNVVCGAEGEGAAVLLRAVEALSGRERMLRNRGGRGGRELTSGPGKLTQAFEIELAHDGQSALRGPLRLLCPAGDEVPRIQAEPSISLSKAAELPYRYFAADHPDVTRSPLNRRARRHSSPYLRGP